MIPRNKAANEGYVTCRRKLLEAGADINTKDIGHFEETALDKACKYHRKRMIAFLKANGAV